MIALSDTVSVLYSTTTTRLEEPIATGGKWATFSGEFLKEYRPQQWNCSKKKKRDPDYEARLKQIGEILSKGVACLLAKEEREREAVTEREVRETVELTADETKVLGLVARFGSVSPSELGDHLKLSRASVARRTTVLEQKGFLHGEGKTSARRFYLTPAGRKATKVSNC